MLLTRTTWRQTTSVSRRGIARRCHRAAFALSNAAAASQAEFRPGASTREWGRERDTSFVPHVAHALVYFYRRCLTQNPCTTTEGGRKLSFKVLSLSASSVNSRCVMGTGRNLAPPQRAPTHQGPAARGGPRRALLPPVGTGTETEKERGRMKDRGMLALRFCRGRHVSNSLTFTSSPAGFCIYFHGQTQR